MNHTHCWHSVERGPVGLMVCCRQADHNLRRPCNYLLMLPEGVEGEEKTHGGTWRTDTHEAVESVITRWASWLAGTLIGQIIHGCPRKDDS